MMMTSPAVPVLLLLVSAAAPDPLPPAPTSAPAAIRPVPPEEVIAAFLDRLGRTDAYDPKAKAFVAASWNQRGDQSPREFIDKALALLSPEFRRGLKLVEAEKPAEAADLFERLSGDSDPYLAVAAANLAATTLIELEQFERCRSMLERVAREHAPLESHTVAADHLRFALGYSQLHTLDYDAARTSLEQFFENYPEAPERLRVAARQIVGELRQRAAGRLGDVRDLLDYARRRISQGTTGEPVLERQEEAVALLSDLIKEAEEQEEAARNANPSAGGGRGKPSGAQPGSAGARLSTLPRGGSREGELRRTRARPGESWGKMPPREREQILQSLQRRFPSQYRELLEQYYRELAREAPPP